MWAIGFRRVGSAESKDDDTGILPLVGTRHRRRQATPQRPSLSHGPCDEECAGFLHLSVAWSARIGVPATSATSPDQSVDASAVSGHSPHFLVRRDGRSGINRTTLQSTFPPQDINVSTLVKLFSCSAQSKLHHNECARDPACTPAQPIPSGNDAVAEVRARRQ
jgi:hypothetical protein